MELNGKAAEAIRRRQIVTDALLTAVGTYQGGSLDPSLLAAIDLVKLATTLTVADDKLAVVFEGIAMLRDLARSLGAELPEQAAQQEPSQQGEQHEQPEDPPHDAAKEAATAIEATLREPPPRDERIADFARRLRPIGDRGERPTFGHAYGEAPAVEPPQAG